MVHLASLLMHCIIWWAQEQRVGLELWYPGTFGEHQGKDSLLCSDINLLSWILIWTLFKLCLQMEFVSLSANIFQKYTFSNAIFFTVLVPSSQNKHGNAGGNYQTHFPELTPVVRIMLQWCIQWNNPLQNVNLIQIWMSPEQFYSSNST